MASLVVITTNEDPNTAFSEPSSAEEGSSAGEGEPLCSPLDSSFGADPGSGLIPGFPDEISLRILAFVPYLRRLPLSLVCKAWRNCFRSTAVYNARHHSGCLEELLCLSFLEGSSPCLSLKLLDRQRWRWLPLATEYKYTKCKVRSFQCRAFHHKVFVFSNADWAVLKQANWPNLEGMRALGAPLDVPDVVPCRGSFYSLDGSAICSLCPETRTWVPVVDLPKRQFKSGSHRQKYFLVALEGRLGLIDVWQERWWWRAGKVKANMSFLDLGSSTDESADVGGARAKWVSLHQPVSTNGKDIAGFAVFQV